MLLNLLKQRKKKYSLIILLFIFLIITSKAYQYNALSFHFVDEEENFVLAKYLLQGEKLYSDLFATHQPIPYLLSAVTQEVTQPNSIFLLIKRHREVIILWSVIWSLLLIIRFGLWYLPVIIIYETSKIYLLGNLFLAETFTVYPLMYLVTLVIGQKQPILKKELVWIGVSIGLIFFTLAPLWPLVFFIACLIYWRNRQLQTIIYQILGFLLVFFLIARYVSWLEYYYYPIYTNLKYFIPIASSDPFLVNSIKALFTPLLAFLQIDYFSQTQTIIRIVSIIWVVILITLIKRKNYYLLVTTTIILTLANIRFVQPGLQYYQGFHLLPWYGLFIMVTVFFTHKLYNHLSTYFRVLLLCFWVITVFVSSKYALGSLFDKKDIKNELFINYSRQFDAGEAVRIMKGNGDNLFVAPDEWLVYWQADIKHAHALLDFYAWMYSVPYLNSSIHQIFKTSPPVFFYVNNRDVTLKKYYSKYIEIKKDGKGIGLFVLPYRLQALSQSQKGQLKFLGFNVD